MKTFLCVTLVAAFAAIPLIAIDAQPPAPTKPSASTPPPTPTDRLENTVMETGAVYELETTSPLVDGPDRVTVLRFGPKNWVYVEYEQSVLKPGELLPAPRKSNMWINFDHVIAARQVTPAPKR